MQTKKHGGYSKNNLKIKDMSDPQYNTGGLITVFEKA